MGRAGFRRAAKTFAAAFAAAAILLLLSALLPDTRAVSRAWLGGVLLIFSYFGALAFTWVDGKAIPMRNGSKITKEGNKVAYMFQFLCSLIFGLVALLVFGSNV
jgi:hypothetical protein